MIAVDTDVLAIYHIFHKDRRYENTKTFFERINERKKAITVFNLLELCGILACATRVADAQMLFDTYIAAEDVVILFPDLIPTDQGDFWSTLVSECFARIRNGMRFGDAVILWTLETNENISALVTWNTKHFKGKSSLGSDPFGISVFHCFITFDTI